MDAHSLMRIVERVNMQHSSLHLGSNIKSGKDVLTFEFAAEALCCQLCTKQDFAIVWFSFQ